ncbi:MAG: M20/M25/M40 family metallo-hydrolase [Gemmatimonadota bacterium]|nr:M20/M25/M40 family metallo-hydrolase [Gemmatimonadota bacterium]
MQETPRSSRGTRSRGALFSLVGALCAFAPQQASGQISGLSTADSLLTREIFAELIEIPTVSSTPETVVAARAMAARLRAAGFPAEDVLVGGNEPGGNLVVRFRGTGEQRPILLMAHLDVVPALRSDWSFEPFVFREEDGWLFGRGTTDNTAGSAMLVANFIRYRREGFVPNRDLIVILTQDEETSSGGIKWLMGEGSEWIEGVEYALNTDAGGGSLRDGRPLDFNVQASEKVYLTFQLEVKNPGGHSSVPRKDNAIYALTRGLDRLAATEWPVQFNEISRAYFQAGAEIETDPAVAADMLAATDIPANPEAIDRLAAANPYYNAVMRTTCVTTRLEAGHADNALPQTAHATVNCRVLPGNSTDEVARELARILDDDQITITRVNDPTPSPPSPLTPNLMSVIDDLREQFWPGVPIIPSMSTGATDGLYVRNAGIPVYGVSALFGPEGDIRAHGRDERVGVTAFFESAQYWYLLVKTLSS